MIFGAAAIADILIAGTMAFLVSPARVPNAMRLLIGIQLLRSKTKIHHKSRAVLKRILNLIVETNILSSMCSSRDILPLAKHRAHRFSGSFDHHIGSRVSRK